MAPSNQSLPNLDPQVIEYLVKKGYNRTEQMLRQESSNLDKDGKPIPERVEDLGTQKYTKAFQLLSNWVDSNLDIYKFELKKLLWPVFIYSFLDMITYGFTIDAEAFLHDFGPRFEKFHHEDLQLLETLKLKSHIDENPTAKLYRSQKYKVPLNNNVYQALITFLEANSKTGGTVLLNILVAYLEIKTTERGNLDQYSFEAIVSRSEDTANDEADQEGIPGTFIGVTNKDIINNAAVLKLGFTPMDPDLAADLRAELEDEDIRNPPKPGVPTLIEEHERRIKREESVEGPKASEIPYPPSRARDLKMEILKIKESRDRFTIDTRTGGIGAGISICMWTFHNTLDTATPTNSRRLIGHAGPVYSLSFSPGIASAPGDISGPSTTSKLLLSSSSDKTVRLWSLETFTCLVVYKGHEGPVWNVKWGPFGHYFATCGWDRTVRVWAQDHISFLRMMVGHDTSVNQVAWHPNGAYVFSASDTSDKTVRMWSFVTGECVRVFTGHTEFISALECSPDGKILASADGSGCIILWDLAKGTQIKRCRGHAKGGVWSLSFSVDSDCLISGGADGTVRIWEVKVPDDPYKDGGGEIVGTGGQADATRINGGPATGSQTNTTSGAGGKKKGKETMITADQISAYPTKKSPVYKVKFTQMNCGIAGGVYLP
ncbi:putative Transcription initiation factor TFIID subunit 5 [Glarea lozoyensis 74030]|uniref:Putative Transcription initiation factor TFIID subunit 5 n=1 Tax=Glarea lozoyensis (strain ATCC 74030 / MF5533) TaxID=1104152 RepID=H0EYY7_GLAL7|nr:putative Transcription initiation factor TFIID subunit 5 [Glarea lozoyensis 74030]